MNVSNMQGRVLGWAVAAALPEAKANPKAWNPTENWNDVASFWTRKGAGCYVVPKHKNPSANCIGAGDFEATCEGYAARGATALEAICRVLVYAAFGPCVDIPKEFQR